MKTHYLLSLILLAVWMLPGCQNPLSGSADSNVPSDHRPGITSGAAASCTDNTLNATACTTAASRYVTPSLGGNISISGATSATIALGFQDGTKTCSVSDANLTAANISAGIAILGITGTFRNLASNMTRNKGATQLTANQEVSTYSGTNTIPAGYRLVSKVSSDDDGSSGTNVTFVDRTGWNATTCGLAGTIATRIADCVVAFGANATWDGGAKGNLGQGVWKLVARKGNIVGNTGKEVWQDQRTGLLWSSVIGRNASTNWCKASGSNNIGGNPYADDDPSDICDNATYQNTAGQAVSGCYEDDGTNFTQTDAAITNEDDGKGGLHLTTTPAIAWRLPTRSDYLQAEVNGIRFVMPDMAAIAGFAEWTATITSSTPANAWYFNGESGVVATNARSTISNGIRCVGR